MNEIRKLCSVITSQSLTLTNDDYIQHLDLIWSLFNSVDPLHILPSLALIGQSISYLSLQQIDSIIKHQIFICLRQWCERLLNIWLINGTFNADEQRALFYTYQVFKLLTEWLQSKNDSHLSFNQNEIENINELFFNDSFLLTLSRIINQLCTINSEEIITEQVENDKVQEQLVIKLYENSRPITDDDEHSDGISALSDDIDRKDTPSVSLSADDIELKSIDEKRSKANPSMSLSTDDISNQRAINGDDTSDLLFRGATIFVTLYTHLLQNISFDDTNNNNLYLITEAIMNCLT
ncbi:unnamed protein product, partial [Didymodactylos carnosus]